MLCILKPYQLMYVLMDVYNSLIVISLSACTADIIGLAVTDVVLH